MKFGIQYDIHLFSEAYQLLKFYV